MWADRRQIAVHQSAIDGIRERLTRNEKVINSLTEDKIKNAIAIEQRSKKIADEKATQFLKEWLGELRYGELQLKEFLEFKGLNGKIYRIKKNGDLHEKHGKYWYYKCVVKQHSLPLPDFIASVITASKYDAEFHAHSIRGSREEV